MNKKLLGIGLGALIVFRKPVIVNTIKAANSLNNRFQELTSGMKEEWEDIVAEANFKHMKDSIDRDIQSTERSSQNE